MDVFARVRMQCRSKSGGTIFTAAFQQNEITVPVFIRPEEITLVRPVVPPGENGPFQEPGGSQKSGPEQGPFKQGGTYAGQLSQPCTLPWVMRGSAQNCVQ